MLAEHHGHTVFAKRSHSFAVRVRLMQSPAGLSEELSQEKIIRHRSTNRQNGERSFSYAHSCSIGINDEVGLSILNVLQSVFEHRSPPQANARGLPEK